jgi:hypothetical protein
MLPAMPQQEVLLEFLNDLSSQRHPVVVIRTPSEHDVDTRIPNERLNQQLERVEVKGPTPIDARKYDVSRINTTSLNSL